MSENISDDVRQDVTRLLQDIQAAADVLGTAAGNASCHVPAESLEFFAWRMERDARQALRILDGLAAAQNAA